LHNIKLSLLRNTLNQGQYLQAIVTKCIAHKA
jgi:hypothetical protein